MMMNYSFLHQPYFEEHAVVHIGKIIIYPFFILYHTNIYKKQKIET